MRKRRYTNMIVLLPVIESMLEAGMSHREIEDDLGLEGDRPVQNLLKQQLRTPPRKCMLTAARCAWSPAELCTRKACTTSPESMHHDLRNDCTTEPTYVQTVPSHTINEMLSL